MLFLFSLEGRLKRRTALRMLHRLRSIAHVVDMHQLTKDPENVLRPFGRHRLISRAVTFLALNLPGTLITVRSCSRSRASSQPYMLSIVRIRSCSTPSMTLKA